jgi:sugar phosphate isomerase/epimerase
MKIGVRAHDFGRHSAAELAGIVAGAGFSAVQLAVQKAITGVDSYLSLDVDRCAEIRRAFIGAGIEISVLGCYIEPSLADRDRRLAQIDLFRAGIRSARLLGAKYVGTETTRFDAGEAEREERYALLLDSVLRMTETAEAEDVYAAIEPVRSHTLNCPALTARLLREVGSPRLKVIFDPVNLLDPERASSQDALWRESLDAFGNAICALHVKDLRRDEYGWVPCRLGKGVMDYSTIMNGLRRLGLEPPLLREELEPESAAEDRSFLERLASVQPS